MNRNDFELLAPAGSFESLKASFAAGADAAYMGGLKFGARAYADSTADDCVAEAIDYAHLRNKKLYLTVNTLLKEEEIKKELYSYILPYYEQGLDAVIVQDIGVMSFLHREFPELKLHASTQMTITGIDGAVWAKNMGAVRIVTSREMSLEDIRQIKENVDIEIETFIHGAMCYCYSGQCLMSSLIGGRSGNRGRCAQPCRLPYDVVFADGKTVTENRKNYVLSLKDMCTIDMLPKLMDMGISSFKVEGRMKSPVYTAGVISIYRKYMDMYLDGGYEKYKVLQEDRDALLNLFDRGGQTDGYLRGIKGKQMMAFNEKPPFRDKDTGLVNRIEKNYINKENKISVTGKAEFILGAEAVLKLTKDDITVECRNGTVSKALNRPMDISEIEKRLRKTGGTSYEISSMHIKADDNIFISIKDINELRRKAFELLEKEILLKYKRCAKMPSEYMEKKHIESISSKKVLLNAYVETGQQLAAVLNSRVIDTVYLDGASFAFDEAAFYAEEVHGQGLKCIYVMPAVFKCEARKLFFENYITIAHLFDAVAVKNIDEAQWVTENLPDIPVTAESSLYAYNSEAAGYLCSKGIKNFIMPLELNFGELLRAGHEHHEIVVYGRTPLMITEQCIIKNTVGCRKKPVECVIRDRKHMDFPVKNKCAFCYNVIYNSVATSLISLRDKVRRLSPSALRLDFTTEDEEETAYIIDLYNRGYILDKEVSVPSGQFTKGHFLRGIE